MFVLKNTLSTVHVTGKSKNGYNKVTSAGIEGLIPDSNLEKVFCSLRGYPVVIDNYFKVVKINGITESFLTLLKLKSSTSYELFDMVGITTKELRKIIKHIQNDERRIAGMRY